jgi:hypothetical protein
MNVAVVGIGRIGLPVAATIASKGHRVFGCDVNAALVDRVNRAGNPIPDAARHAAMGGQGGAARRVNPPPPPPRAGAPGGYTDSLRPAAWSRPRWAGPTPGIRKS